MKLHNRIIKATFWRDPELLQWPRDKRWFYLGLIQLAEDSGCLENSPFAFKIELFPSPLDSDITLDLLNQWVQELIEDGKLIPYEANGKQCLYLTNFHKHQSLRSPSPPDTPLPDWIQWQPGETPRSAGKYIIGDPTQTVTSPYGDRTVTVSSPYGDEIKGKEKKGKGREEKENGDRTDEIQPTTEDGNETSPKSDGRTALFANSIPDHLRDNPNIRLDKDGVLRDFTIEWRTPDTVPREEAFRELPAKEQLNLIVKEHRRRFPGQYKRHGTAAVVKAREVFAQAIAEGLDPFKVYIQVCYWDEEHDGPDPPPWRIVQPLKDLGPVPMDNRTIQYVRYSMDLQAITTGVQIYGPAIREAVNA